MTPCHPYASARTRFGRSGGALAEVRPDALAATASSGERCGVAAIRIGVGQALAVVPENVSGTAS
jgi:acetyl-CoA acetyltransferase